MQKALPDFQSIKERDDYFRDHAEYYTLVNKAGVGLYGRTEGKSLAELERLAKTMVTVGGGRYMIYAVIGEQSAFVKAVK